MTRFKRRQRATAKERAGRGRHARPAVQPSQVPEELRPADYAFPRVTLPDTRRLVSPSELRAAMDDDTQPLEPVELLHFGNDFLLAVCDASGTVIFNEELVTCPECLNWLAHVPNRAVLAGWVVDDTPQPAHHAGLAPAHAPVIPVPDNPFLNAHPPRHAAAPVPEAVASAVDGLVAEMRERGLPTEPIQLHIGGNALPARLTDLELTLHGLPVPPDAPAAPSLPAPPQPYRPIRRDARHQLVFASFDIDFWRELEDFVRQTHAGVGGLEMANDAALAALGEHLAKVDGEHQRAILHVAAHEYRGHLADATMPLPHRTPGMALAAIEASRGELVSA